MNVMKIFHINLLLTKQCSRVGIPLEQKSVYLKSHDFGALRALLTLKLFTFYIPVLTGYRSLLMRVEFRTAITPAGRLCDR